MKCYWLIFWILESEENWTSVERICHEFQLKKKTSNFMDEIKNVDVHLLRKKTNSIHTSEIDILCLFSSMNQTLKPWRKIRFNEYGYLATWHIFTSKPLPKMFRPKWERENSKYLPKWIQMVLAESKPYPQTQPNIHKSLIYSSITLTFVHLVGVFLFCFVLCVCYSHHWRLWWLTVMRSPFHHWRLKNETPLNQIRLD